MHILTDLNVCVCVFGRRPANIKHNLSRWRQIDWHLIRFGPFAVGSPIADVTTGLVFIWDVDVEAFATPTLFCVRVLVTSLNIVRYLTGAESGISRACASRFQLTVKTTWRCLSNQCGRHRLKMLTQCVFWYGTLPALFLMTHFALDLSNYTGNFITIQKLGI